MVHRHDRIYDRGMPDFWTTASIQVQLLPKKPQVNHSLAPDWRSRPAVRRPLPRRSGCYHPIPVLNCNGFQMVEGN